MKLNRTSAVTEYKLVSRFEKLREQLLVAADAEKLDKPLAFWALPADRRLPLAFMGCTIRDLLSSSFEDLLSTPGVGQKKISSLVKLLARVAREEPFDEQAASEELPQEAPAVRDEEPQGFDPNVVSEVLWAQWREAVVAHGLGHETLGRFAPSLQHLPRVLWQTPLETYTNLTLAEIRSLKTHGEKRVAAVLEVFGELNKILGRLGAPSMLSVRVVPRFVTQLEAWIVGVLDREALPSNEEIVRHFVEPLLVQVRIDAGDQIADLAESRLGLKGDDSSVRNVAHRMGLTRARIYQLLADVGCMISIRWPEGQKLVSKLVEKIHQQRPAGFDLEHFDATTELFFPGCQGREPHVGSTNGVTAADVLSHRQAG